jgi:hypothetical protein
MTTTLVEFLRSDVETGDWFMGCAMEKCRLRKEISSAGISRILPQATHVTQPIPHGFGVGHSRNPFLNNCVIAINGEI